MENEPTCGRGLAEHSGLPATLGELIAALALNLERHMTTLDLTDENSRREGEAYRQLSNDHRTIADQLHATAARMASYRDLPMGGHDEQAMADPKLLEAFRDFVRVEQELQALLENSVRRDRALLDQMGA